MIVGEEVACGVAVRVGEGPAVLVSDGVAVAGTGVEVMRGVRDGVRVTVGVLVIVGDTVRKTLATAPKLDVLRQAARRDGMKSLQEEGVLLVAKGVTSLPELMRALKQ